METDRIVLRRWRDADAEALFKCASDPELGLRAGWPPHLSVEESLEAIHTYFNNDTTWAIVLKETNAIVGCVGYHRAENSNITIDSDCGEVGYWVARPYWNQGLCTEALQLVIDHCFKEQGYSALWGIHFVDNPASGKVMEKCGFHATSEETTCPNLLVGNDKPVRVLKLLAPKERFRFNTVGLFTRDNKATVEFYTKAFGFATEWDGVQPNVEMALGAMRIILFPRDAFEQMVSHKFQYPEGLNGTVEIAFDVPTFADVDKEYLHALACGATSVLPPTTEPWGQRTCYVADPDGNLIEIGSFYKILR